MRPQWARLLFGHRHFWFQVVVGISMGLPLLAALGLIGSESVRGWTAALLESAPAVRHQKAVLAARNGRFEESIALFESALAAGVGDAAWVDYVRALSWAERSSGVLRAWDRMPETARAHQDVLAAVVKALAGTGAHGSIPAVMARILDGVDAREARRLREAIADLEYGAALRALQEGLRHRPGQALWAERHLRDALRWSAVSLARSGRPDAALAPLDDLASVTSSPDPGLVSDQLVVLCWARRSNEAIERFLSAPAGLELPGYAVAELVRAWRGDGRTASLPADTLARLLERTSAHPDAGSQLVEGARTVRHLERARAARAGGSAPAGRLARAIDHRLAVLLAREGRHDESVSLLRRLLVAEPDSRALRADLVTVLSWAGRHAEALRWARGPLGADPLPQYAALALRRSRAALEERRAERRRRAVELAQSGDPEAAARLIEGVQPRGEADLAARALVMARAGRHREAMLSFEALSGATARPIQLLEALARSYREDGRTERALELWQEILEREPGNRSALEQGFEVLFEARRLGEAHAYLADAERRGSSVALFRARLAHREAVELAQSGEHERALAHLERAVHQLDLHSASRAGAPSGPRSPRRRPTRRRSRSLPAGRARATSLSRMSVALAAVIALGHAPRARAGAPPGDAAHGVIVQGGEASRLRSAVAWDRVAVLSWAGMHWEAVEAFESLADREVAPPYVKREAAEAYRATHRPGAALLLYASILAGDPEEADALRRLRSLLLEHAPRFLEPGLSRLARYGPAAPSWLAGQAWVDPANGRAVGAALKGDPVAALRALRTSLQAPSTDRALLRDYVILLYLSRRFREVVALSDAVPGGHARSVGLLVSAAHAACGDREEALAVAYRWHERAPEEAGVSAELVHRLLALGRTEEAAAFAARLERRGGERLAADVLLHQGSTAEAAARYAARLESEPGDAEAMLGLAAASAMQGPGADAGSLTARALERLSLDDHLLHRALPAPAALALGRVFNELRRPDGTIAVMAPLLAAAPDHLEALWLLGQARELEQERLEAAEAYGQILRTAPGNTRAAEARIRVLLELAAVTPVRAEVGARESVAALGRFAVEAQAAQDWELPRGGSARASASAGRGGLELASARWRLVEDRARAVLATLRAMEGRGVHLAEPALRVAAEAHLELDEPDRALQLYRSLQARLEARGAEKEADHLAIRLEQVRALTRMMRFEEAGRLLDGVDAELTPYVASRAGGPLLPNWGKADVAVERGSWLVAQDRLGEAERHFALMVERAPQSAAARCGLADTSHLRGWTRRAQREFEEAAALHPDDVDIRVGLAQALHANGEVARAERIAGELASAFPDDRHVRELARALELARSWELSSEAEAGSSAGIADGLETRVAMRKPVGPRADLGLTLGWKREGAEGRAVERSRTAVSGRMGLHRDVTLAASASAEPWERRWGVAAEILFVPTDQLSLGLRGDTDSWSLPPGATVERLSGRALEASAEYRRDEGLALETRLRLLALSDGNRVLGGSAGAELQLLATGHWRARLGLQAGAEGSRLDEVAYFSPARSWHGLVSPSIEHVWRRSGRYQLVDRWRFEAGLDHESGFGAAGRGALAYQQQHRFRDLAELLVEVALVRRHYGGRAELGWQVDLGARFRL